MSSAILPASDRLLDTFSAGQRDVLECIAGGAPLPDLLERIVHLVERQASGMYCSIVLLDADKRHIRHGAAPSLPEAYNRTIDHVEIGPEAVPAGRRPISAGESLWKTSPRILLGRPSGKCR